LKKSLKLKEELAIPSNTVNSYILFGNLISSDTIERIDLIRNAIDIIESKGEQLKDLEVLKKLASEKKEKRYAKKEHIYREDDAANSIFFVQSGRVKCVKKRSRSKLKKVGLHLKAR